MTKLTNTNWKTVKPGTYRDEDGLELEARQGRTKVARSWKWRKTIDGVTHKASIGPVANMTLSEARVVASNVLGLVQGGISAKSAINRTLNPHQSELDYSLTAVVNAAWADKYDDLDGKNAKAWVAAIQRRFLPKFGDRDVFALTVTEMRKDWQEYFNASPDMCIKTIERFAYCVDFARRMEDENPHSIDPQKWRDLRKELLNYGRKNDAAIQRDEAERGFQSVSFRKVAHLWQKFDLARVTDLSLMFIAMNVVRIGSFQKATWDQFDWDEQTWTIPAANLRMKDRGDFTIPLTNKAMDVLQKLHDVNGDAPLVGQTPYTKPGVAISGNALKSRLAALDAISPSGRVADTHGFRSSFQGWADDKLTGLDNEVEWCLHHKFWTKTQGSYKKERKATMFLDKRRMILSQWQAWLTGDDPEAFGVVPDGVVSFSGAKSAKRAL